MIVLFNVTYGMRRVLGFEMSFSVLEVSILRQHYNSFFTFVGTSP